MGLGTVGKSTPTRKPATGKIRTGDTSRRGMEYPADRLRPEKLSRILKDADIGNIRSLMFLYEQIEERDSRIASGLQTRRLAASGKSWSVVPGLKDSPEHLTQAEFVEYNFRRLLDFDKDLADLLDALGKGFSVSELIWQDILQGEFAGKSAIIDLIHVRQTRFIYDSDDQTNPRLVRDAANFTGDALDEGELANKFITFRDRSRTTTGNRAGLLRPLTWLYLFKNYSWKDWSVFAEVYGQPYRIGKYDNNATKEQQNDLFKAVVNMGRDAGCIISKDMEIELKEAAKTNSETPSERMIALVNTEITGLILGHAGSGQSTPGQLGGETSANEVRQDLLDSDVSGLSSTLSQAIRFLIDVNYGPQLEYPRIVFDTSPALDLGKEAVKDTALQKMGLDLSKAEMYARYGRAAPSDNEDTLKPVQSVSPGFPLAQLSHRGHVHTLAASTVPSQDTPEGIYYHEDRAIAAFEVLRVGLEKQINSWSSFAEAPTLSIPAGAVEAIGSDLYEQDMIAYLGGRFDIKEQAEARRGSFTATGGRASFMLDGVGASVVFDMPFDEAVDWFMDQGAMPPADFARLSDLQKQRHFTLAASSNQTAIEATQAQIGIAIEEGQTLAEFRKDLAAVWDAVGISAQSPHYTALVYNQNLSTALHAGHFEATFDPALAGAFPFLEYNALLDNTRPEHEAMHGRVYRREDSIWQVWYPPNGFNCHCSVLLISVEEAQARGLIPETQPPTVPGPNGQNVFAQPDTGFQANPSEMFRSI